MKISAIHQNYKIANFASKYNQKSNNNSISNNHTTTNVINNQSHLNSTHLKASLPNISFSGYTNKLSATQQITTEFGLDLYKRIIAGEDIDINAEIKAFMLENDVKNEHKQYFRKLIDARGVEFHAPSSTMSQIEFGLEGSFTFDIKTPLTNPVRLYVGRFEQYLSDKASITVQIK